MRVCLRGADGQKIAKRLCTQITKETRGVQCLVAEYNATQECPEENILTAEALDPSKLQLRLQYGCANYGHKGGREARNYPSLFNFEAKL